MGSDNPATDARIRPCLVNVLCGLWMLASAVFFFGFFTAAFVEANREALSGLFP